MTAYFIPKEPTKRTIKSRLKRLEDKMNREKKLANKPIKPFTPKTYEHLGHIIERPKEFRYEILGKVFATLHESKKYIELIQERERKKNGRV